MSGPELETDSSGHQGAETVTVFYPRSAWKAVSRRAAKLFQEQQLHEDESTVSVHNNGVNPLASKQGQAGVGWPPLPRGANNTKTCKKYCENLRRRHNDAMNGKLDSRQKDKNILISWRTITTLAGGNRTYIRRRKLAETSKAVDGLLIPGLYVR